MKGNNEFLRSAAVAGSLDEVTRLLEQGALIDFLDDNGNSILIHCILNTVANQKQIVQLLLDNKANIALMNRVGKNALQVAIEQKNSDLIEIILTKIRSLALKIQEECICFVDGTNAFEAVLATGNKELVKRFLASALNLPSDELTAYKYRLRAEVIILAAEKDYLKELIETINPFEKHVSEALANLLSHTAIKYKNNPDYKKAYDVTAQMIGKLINIDDVSILEKQYPRFIEEARITLKDHREWNKGLIGFFMALPRLLYSFAANLCLGLSANTKSEQLLNELDTTIQYFIDSKTSIVSSPSIA